VGDGVLEGYVDLVIEEDDGLVVVDYKTDRTGGRPGLDAAAVRYRPQVASYALALGEATGRSVRRAVLVFVGDGAPIEVVLEGAELADACGAARRSAAELLAVSADVPGLR
jgi:ATP-dependent helicase/nuclease subunit A